MTPAATPAQRRRSQAATHAKIDALLAQALRLRASDYSRALATAVQAQQLAETYGHARATVDSLLMQTSCHSEMAQHAEAMICAQRALRLSLAQGDESRAMVCLKDIGQQFSLTGNYRRALRYLEKMLVLGRKLGDVPGEGTALCLIALNRQYLGEMREAGEAFAEALALTRRHKLREMEARVRVNLGEYRLTLNDPAGSVAELRRALKLYTAAGDFGWAALVKGNLGPALCSVRQFSAARRCLTESLEYFRGTRGVRMQGFALINLSEVECLSGRFPEALKLAANVLRLARRTGDKRQEIYALEALGKARCGSGDRVTGRALLDQALALAKLAEDRQALQAVRASLARLSG